MNRISATILKSENEYSRRICIQGGCFKVSRALLQIAAKVVMNALAAKLEINRSTSASCPSFVSETYKNRPFGTRLRDALCGLLLSSHRISLP